LGTIRRRGSKTPKSAAASGSYRARFSLLATGHFLSVRTNLALKAGSTPPIAPDPSQVTRPSILAADTAVEKLIANRNATMKRLQVIRAIFTLCSPGFGGLPRHASASLWLDA
jgi:hypothetical protein